MKDEFVRCRGLDTSALESTQPPSHSLRESDTTLESPNVLQAFTENTKTFPHLLDWQNFRTRWLFSDKVSAIDRTLLDAPYVELENGATAT